MFKSTIYLVIATALFTGFVNAAPLGKKSPIVLPPGSEPLFKFNPDLPFYVLKRDLYV
ncbi:hypothetical protein BDM02DRAFT_3187648 [Thelephora ganbajun]|uniref:Uncharacterized protein n=1 Tax=Thelephora ganbajun TaxID=370292 RepID=A0ACB6ZEE5_THEGA|nr:hypothetical protein BDM02DRAFT_3187648 [Thelephora ganbajun]